MDEINNVENILKVVRIGIVNKNIGEFFHEFPIPENPSSKYKIVIKKNYWYESLWRKLQTLYIQLRYNATCLCPCHFGKPGFYHCWIDCCEHPNKIYKNN